MEKTKNGKKFLAAVLTVLMSIVIFGNLPLADSTVYAAMPEIKNVRISSEGILSWDAFSGATNYNWSVGSGGGNTKDTQADLKQACLDYGFASGTYDVKLFAEKNGEQISMVWEGSYSYTSANPQLATPVNLSWNGNIATWDAVPNAECYAVNLDGDSRKFFYGVQTNSCDMTKWLKDGTGEYSFNVWAMAKGYPDSKISDRSPVATLTVTRPEMKNVRISDEGILSWDAFDGAGMYDCNVGDNFNGNTDKTEIDIYEFCKTAGYAPGTYDVELCAYSDYGWKGGYQVSAVWKGTYNYTPKYDVTLVSGYFDSDNNLKIDQEGICGTVSLSKTRVEKGDEVTVTVKPNDDYKLKSIAWSNDYAMPTDITSARKFTVGDGQPYVFVYFQKDEGFLASLNCTITEPVAGAHPDMNPVSGDPSKYDVEIDCWYIAGTSTQLKSTDVFRTNVTYAVRVRFTAKSGYHFDSAASEFTVNGKCNGMYAYNGPEAQFRATGTNPKEGWEQNGNDWQYFESGKAVTGWKKISGSWYYFDTDGKMLKDWQQIEGVWYYFGGNGVMRTGWQQIGTAWYYFTGSGAMVTSWQQISGKWYYFTVSGAMVTGWQKIGEVWYYFESSGAMATGWKEINGVYYFFKSNGSMAANEYCGGYWLDASGAWTYKYKASWKQNATGWWYGDDSGWYAKDQTLRIDDKNYNFNASGYCTNP